MQDEAAPSPAPAGEEAGGASYRVSLRRFTGPLDLLLYLVRHHELDILEIPVATITDAYLSHLRQIRDMDLEVASEFLVLAAALVEIKTRMLLPVPPQAPDDEPDEDPRLDLIRRLLEFRRVKDQAETLARLLRERRRRLPARTVADLPEEPGEIPLAAVGLFDLAAAYARILKEITMNLPVRLVYDDRPVAEVMEQLLRRLRIEGPLSFFALFREHRERARGIGIFLAILELVRGRQIRVEQAASFGDIRILPAEGDDGGAPV